MENIKKILGEELFANVIEKLGDNKIGIINDGSYIPRGVLNEVKDKNKALTSQVENYESQLVQAKKLVSSNDELKTQFADLQNKHKEELTNIQTNLINSQKSSYVREGLIKAGIKDQYLDLHLKGVDLNSITISDDGVSGVTNIVDNLKTNFADSFQNVTIKTNTDTSKSESANGWADIAKKFI